MMAARLMGTFVLAAVLGGAGCAARSAATLGDASAVHDWSAVMALEEGTSLRLDLSAGPSTSGRLVSAEAAQITISSGSSKRTLLVPDIRRVALVQRRTKQKAKWGLIIGAVGGGQLGGLATQSSQGAWAAMLAAGWGAIGAAIGASDGFFDHEERTVYVASNVTTALRPKAPASGRGRARTSR